MTWLNKALFWGAMAVLAAPAQAALVESVRVENFMGYIPLDTGDPELDRSGMMGYMRTPFTELAASGAPTSRTEIGIEFIGYANEQTGSFYFLHNNMCVGMCSTASRTEIQFTIYNDGPDAEELRFDSIITPGHLARLGNSGFSSAGFDFSVIQDIEGFNERELYGASGRVSSTSMGVTTNDGSRFNGMTDIVRADNWAVLDWGATNLNLGLGQLGAGQTTTVTYIATYHATTFETCLDLTRCSGVQVVFGDPRANGGGSNIVAMSALAEEEEPARDAINFGYDQYASTFAVRKASDPLPEQPDAMPVLRYGNGFTPLTPAITADVPESSTWSVMILGLSLIGAAARSRRRPRFA